MTISVSSETTKKYQENRGIHRVDDHTLVESFKFIMKVNLLQY